MKVFLKSQDQENSLPDATYLTSVPGSGKKATSVLLVVFRHLQAVHPFHVEANLVLRVKLSTWLAQLTLEDTLVGPAKFTLQVSVLDSSELKPTSRCLTRHRTSAWFASAAALPGCPCSSPSASRTPPLSSCCAPACRNGSKMWLSFEFETW